VRQSELGVRYTHQSTVVHGSKSNKISNGISVLEDDSSGSVLRLPFDILTHRRRAVDISRKAAVDGRRKFCTRCPRVEGRIGSTSNGQRNMVRITLVVISCLATVILTNGATVQRGLRGDASWATVEASAATIMPIGSPRRRGTGRRMPIKPL
jgi:hypothetical protein